MSAMFLEVEGIAPQRDAYARMAGAAVETDNLRYYSESKDGIAAKRIQYFVRLSHSLRLMRAWILRLCSIRPLSSARYNPKLWMVTG